jgi:hypothetical protein
MKNKTCVKCNEKQPINKFYKAKSQKDGYDYYCKHCRTGSALKSHRGGKRKPECTVDGCNTHNYAVGMCKMHYERNRRNGHPGLVNYGRESYNGQPYEKVRESHLKRRFHITTEQYEEMAKNGCEICGKKELPHKQLHVDHDHKCCDVPRYPDGSTKYHNTCGQCIRGVLCDKCNGNVGLYEKDKMREDYPDRDKIINYVAKYNWLISDRIVSNDKKQGNR